MIEIVMFQNKKKQRMWRENAEKMAQLRIQDADAYIQQQAPVSAIAGGTTGCSVGVSG